VSDARAVTGVGVSADDIAARLRHVMLEAYLARIVLLHGCAPMVEPQPPERPLASPLARAQAAAGAPAVSSLLHDNVRLEDETERALLPLLDGTSRRDHLTRALGQRGARVRAPQNGPPVVDPVRIETALQRFASVGLLMR
jgi:hypothetical protein